MVNKDIFHIFTLVANDRYIRFSALTITVATILLAVFFSSLAGLIVFGSYILGYIVCWSLIQYQNSASTYLQALINYCYSYNVTKKHLKHSCSICDDMSCRRHQQKNVAPWRHLYIQKDLNSSIEHFYNKILENFVMSWYGQFTNDSDFVNELRYCLRHASAMVINTFLEIDHIHVISSKLLPCVVKHVDDYLYMQQIVKLKNARLDDVIVEYLGKRLHVATTNRRNELSYLQHLCSCIMPHILPEKYLQCRNYSVLIREILAGWVLLPLMDVLADPNIINSLVILAATYKSKKSHNKEVIGTVEFLDKFVTNSTKKSPFSTDLNTIKENTDLLYAFMQFLKREEHVHLLQFCLDVDEFNNKLLSPDLSKKQLEELHGEALTLYKEYLSRDSLNFVGCPEEITRNLHSLIKEGVYNVVKLRTSKPLYQAYEHTFNNLENVWLPLFFHSNEFYGQICGSKITASYNKAAINRSSLLTYGSPVKTRSVVKSGLIPYNAKLEEITFNFNRSRKYYEAPSQGTVARISSGLGKIKGALRTTSTIEGAVFPTESQLVENGTVEDIIITDCGNIFRDLSAWRVSILSYQTTNKIVSFCINVQRLDAVDDDSKRHWIVLRKDQDFYTLKAKLVEFHGESEICDSPLPSRKAGSPLDVRMSRYEDFLKKLLQKPSLRGSDLLYTFLTAEADFTTVIANSAQNSQDLGNIYQSVAHKLRKEKGQHLDSFMTTFLTSTGKIKQGKFEWAEIGDEVDVTASNRQWSLPTPKTFRNYIFNDNFGIPYKAARESSSSSFNPVGVTECLFYLFKYIFKVPYYTLRLYAAICSVAQEAVESLLGIFIERKLRSSLNPSNLAYLINLLEDVVFHPRTSPSREELEQRKIIAFQELEDIAPSIVVTVLGKDFPAGLRTLLEILQHPHYNKQLVYNLVDVILLEMYPTLGKC